MDNEIKIDEIALLLTPLPTPPPANTTPLPNKPKRNSIDYDDDPYYDYERINKLVRKIVYFINHFYNNITATTATTANTTTTYNNDFYITQPPASAPPTPTTTTLLKENALFRISSFRKKSSSFLLNKTNMDQPLYNIKTQPSASAPAQPPRTATATSIINDDTTPTNTTTTTDEDDTDLYNAEKLNHYLKNWYCFYMGKYPMNEKEMDKDTMKILDLFHYYNSISFLDIFFVHFFHLYHRKINIVEMFIKAEFHAYVFN